MAGYDSFQHTMLTVATNNISRGIKSHASEFEEVLWNHLLDRAGPRVLDKKLTINEQFFAKIWHGFLEICSSLKTLQDIEVYIRRFPYAKTPITRPRHLRYHIESHFNEVYILRERLKTFLTMVERLYRKNSCYDDVRRTTKLLSKLVTDILESVTNTHMSGLKQQRVAHYCL
jgi:hypothetical protein